MYNVKGDVMWEIIGHTVMRGNKSYKLCRCVCGVEREIRTDGINKRSQSCGCLNEGRLGRDKTTHGLYRHPLYTT